MDATTASDRLTPNISGPKRVLMIGGALPPPDTESVDFLKKEKLEVEVFVGALTEDELVERIKGFNAVILGAPRLTRRVILSADELEIIVRGGVGIDNIDVTAATEKGVVVVNMPGAGARTVAEHAIMMMLAISRGLVVADRSVRTNHWRDFAMIVHPEMSGKTVGVIGLGAIGCAVAGIARKAFDMKVLTHDNPHLKPELVEQAQASVVPLDRLLGESDYVVLSVPLNSETEKMIGARELALMRESSYLINVARGKIVDQQALYRALSEKRIAGAALDVLEKQPPDSDDPLLKLDNVIFTPHDAAITRESGKIGAMLLVKGLVDLFNGKLPSRPINMINTQVANEYVKRRAENA